MQQITLSTEKQATYSATDNFKSHRLIIDYEKLFLSILSYTCILE